MGTFGRGLGHSTIVPWPAPVRCRDAAAEKEGLHPASEGPRAPGVGAKEPRQAQAAPDGDGREAGHWAGRGSGHGLRGELASSRRSASWV